jgi:Type II secretion system (T2SS), protein G
MTSEPESSPPGGNDPDVIHLDLRTILPIAAFGIIVLVIIFIELCGRDDVEPLASAPDPVDTATQGPAVATETADPSTTAEAPTPTTGSDGEPGEGERDVTRQQDLAAIASALAEYRTDSGSYPDSNGDVQSLCAFDVDAGCELSEVLDPIPEDPLGDPGTNGYWYASDGDTFTAWAQRESDQGEECDNHPDHLSSFDSLFCVAGP